MEASSNLATSLSPSNPAVLFNRFRSEYPGSSQQSGFSFPKALTEKYQPQSVDEFVGLEKPKRILSKFLQAPYPSAWFFLGPPGTGKTAMALAIARQLNADLKHIPSQKCTVAEVEEAVRMCHYIPRFGVEIGGQVLRFNLVLVDEADKMSPAAQLAFLSKLDATAFPPNTIFIFTANDTGSLEPRFLSRCRAIEFSSYGMAGDASKFLDAIWEREAPGAEKPNFAQIMRNSRNNLRDALMQVETELLAA